MIVLASFISIYGYGGRGDEWYFLNDLYQAWNFNQSMRINVKPNQGGVNSGILALTAFTANNRSVLQNETFKITVSLKGVDIFSGGHVGAALVDTSGKIVAIAGITSIGEINPGLTLSNREIICYVPENVNTGQYSLRIVSRPTDGEWRIVTLSTVRDGVSSSIPFTVNRSQSVTSGGGYGLALQDFTVDKVSVSRNEAFSVFVRTRNIDQNVFPGGFIGVALIANNGSIVEVIKSVNFGGSLNHNSTRSINNLSDCIVPNTVNPGQYRLGIVTRPTNNNEWRIATMSIENCPTSYNFTVR
jgi:hypothetical protein